MDCVQASEILSTSHDGANAEATQVAEAHRHCETCVSCSAFRETLSRLESLPAPSAPDALVSRLVSLGAEAAADIRESEIAARALAEAGFSAASPGVAGASGRAHGRSRLLPERWTPRFTAYAAAAAVLLVTLGAGGVAVVGLLGANRATDTEMMSLESPLPPAGDDQTDGAFRAQGFEDAASSAAADAEYQAQTAPSYVVYDRTVWRLDATADAAPSTLPTSGVVTSSLGTAGEAAEHTAYLAADGETLWVAADGGSYLLFSRVVRTLGLTRYALRSDTDLARFGLWPALPARYTSPQSPDGSPTFMASGFDDSGRSVYIPFDGRIEDGFALAPGTPPDDPAAGNPNWTWWEPLR
jgi:hypothetical protein